MELNKMNICMISTFPPHRCGVGDYTSDLCKALAKCGIEIDVLTYTEQGAPINEELSNGLRVHRLLKRSDGDTKVWSIIQMLQPKIIHFQSTTFLHARRINVFAKHIKNIPIITTVHDSPTSWRLFHVIPFLRYIYRKSDKIIVHTNQTAATLIKFHSVQPEKIVTLPHGVDTKKYRPEVNPNEFRCRYNLKGCFVILFFGFIRPGKGLEYLIDAFREVSYKIPHARLVIAGDVPQDRKRYLFGLKSEANYIRVVKKAIKNAAIENKVIFTGYVPEEDVPMCLASADVIIFPYLGASQSGPMHKALGSGCIIIATEVGGNAELIENGITGILVPPKDSDAIAKQVLKLYENNVTSIELRRNARKMAEEMSWDNIATKTIKIYKEVIV